MTLRQTETGKKLGSSPRGTTRRGEAAELLPLAGDSKKINSHSHAS